MHVEPAAVRRAWHHGEDAVDGLVDARTHVTAAAGTGMGDLAAVLGDAAGDMDGVLEVAGAVVVEHGTNIEGCLQQVALTDGASAGTFEVLDAYVG